MGIMKSQRSYRIAGVASVAAALLPAFVFYSGNASAQGRDPRYADRYDDSVANGQYGLFARYTGAELDAQIRAHGCDPATYMTFSPYNELSCGNSPAVAPTIPDMSDPNVSIMVIEN